MSFYVASRHFAALISAASIVFQSPITLAQDADEGGDDVLALNVVCGSKYADTPSIGECLRRQNGKADRWLQAVIESYARWAAKEMEIQRGYGGVPIDQVAQLRMSQATFETYRQESAELVRQSYDGMGGGLGSAMAYFKLTVDRARFVLDTCNHALNARLTDRVDMTIVDWCPAGL